ncbi:MAG: T9SS type A sorting domain-containing protein [Lewinellaceae bacterium]|nr:T9SS type A sorting domain-containing protein [Lewinellaceae bacterium]
MGFIRDLLDTLQATYNIDANRVYSTGMSNGGFMSYSLACELNDRIAAIASVTGSMIQSKLNACNPARPVPVMEIHGTADNTVPYTGSPISTFVSIPTLMAKWVDFNNCNPTPTITQVPNTNTSDGCTAERQLYTGGDQGSTVEHYKITGGGHTWPGALFNIGVTNQDFNASKEIWRFFSQYRLDQLSATKTPESLDNQWTAFPNPTQDYLVLQSKDQRPVDRIQVFDALGRLQQTLSPSAGEQIRIETATWAVGMYWVVIEQEGVWRGLWRLKRMDSVNSQNLYSWLGDPLPLKGSLLRRVHNLLKNKQLSLLRINSPLGVGGHQTTNKPSDLQQNQHHHGRRQHPLQSSRKPRRTIQHLARRPGKRPGLERCWQARQQSRMPELYRRSVDGYAPVELAEEDGGG